MYAAFGLTVWQGLPGCSALFRADHGPTRSWPEQSRLAVTNELLDERIGDLTSIEDLMLPIMPAQMSTVTGQ
jgi:hypothetical protein